MENNRLFRRIDIMLVLFVLLIILFLGFYLRYREYQSIPFAGQSLDEYSYAWVGLSLIEMGYPVGISGLPSYEKLRYEYINPDYIYQSGLVEGKPLMINYPWFDHPPFLGLLTGGYAYFHGARNFADVSLAVIRKPMILLSVISLSLVILIAWSLSGRIGAIWAGGIYAVSGLVIVSSRMIQGENGWLPFYLFVVWLISLGYKRWTWIVALVLGLVGAGFKLTGGVSFLFMLMMVISDRNYDWRWKSMRIKEVLICGAGGLGLYSLYGIWFGWGQFWDIQMNNVGRAYGIGFDAIFNLIITSKITNLVTMTDPWILLGWICWIGLWFIPDSKYRLIKLGGLAYLLVYLLMGSYAYGWYHVPFYPFLILAIGVLMSITWNCKGSLVGLSILYLILCGWYLSKIWSFESVNQMSGYWKMFILLIIGGSWLVDLFDFRYKKYVIRSWMIFGFAVSMILAISYFRLIDVDMWYRIN